MMSENTLLIEADYKKICKPLKHVRLNLVIAIICLLTITCPLNTKAEKASLLPNCSGQVCFKRPSSAVISSDGSFVLVTDSSNPDEEGIYLRKFNFQSDSLIDGGQVQLKQTSLDAPLLSIALSQDNKKVLVYRDPTEGENTQLQIVDLTNNSVKEITSLASNGLSIGLPVFNSASGDSVVAPLLNEGATEAIILDTQKDQITEHILSVDSVQSVFLCPLLRHLFLTFSGNHGQSVFVRDLITKEEKLFSIDATTSLSVGDFLNRIDFDLLGNMAVLSSLSGAHVVHFLDVENKKLTSLILDKASDGSTLSTISGDGKTAITIGNVLDITSGFKIYKTKLDSTISLENSGSFLDDSIVLDLRITPDQSKILVLILKDDKKKLRVLNMKDLTLVGDFDLSSDFSQSSLSLDPNGRYGITTDLFESSVSVLQDFNLGPVLRNIIPNIVSVKGGTPFTLNGFIDPLRFSSDAKVCFGNTQTCASSVKVSKTGLQITGWTPKFLSPQIVDLLLTAKSKLDSSLKTSTYEKIFSFVQDGLTLSDSVLPEITIQAPKDNSIFNTKRIFVLGKVDGTGGEVKSVTVNGKEAILSSEGQSSPNIVNFTGDIELTSDGQSEIKIVAKDVSNNSNEKIIKVTIDTSNPVINANAETSGSQFNVSGTVDGTGTNVKSIVVNLVSVTFTAGEKVNFSAVTNKLPIVITASDSAGNKKEINISNPGLADKDPPEINVISPAQGDIFKTNPVINVSFSVTDTSGVKEIIFNKDILPLSPSGNYLQNITLKPGENLITISATDTLDNKTSTSIKVTFISSGQEGTKPPKPGTGEIQEEKEIISLPSDFEDLNSAILDEVSGIIEETGKILDISATASVEIANPPPIPEGEEAEVDIPKIEGIETTEEEVPKGFSFATTVDFKETGSNVVEITEEEKDNQNTTVLVDSAGRTFVVGFAFLKEVESNTLGRKYKFQTTDGTPLELATTITIPADATEGDARVSILNKNQSLATIPLKVAPQKEVKVGKRTISKPQIQEPITAIVKKSGKELVLKVKGRNFIKKIAVVDGVLQKLIDRTKFLTNVTFVPSEGIKIKRFKVLGNSILLNATLNENISPGIKLFNVITPKGADIGAIVFPDPITDGKLETTATPESLILID